MLILREKDSLEVPQGGLEQEVASGFQEKLRQILRSWISEKCRYQIAQNGGAAVRRNRARCGGLHRLGMRSELLGWKEQMISAPAQGFWHWK